MSTSQISQIALLVIVAAVAVFGIVKYVKQKVSAVNSTEDLINLLVQEAKEVVLPFITKLALKDELTGSLTYDDFKAKCNNKLTLLIYDYLSNADVQKKLNISESLAMFITKETISNFLNKALSIQEVDDLLYSIYLELIEDNNKAAEQLEAETAAINAEIGVDDEKLLEKEDLGLVKDDSDDTDDGTINIGGELNGSIADDELVEPLK